MRVRGVATYLQPKAPAPMMRMEEGAADSSGGLGDLGEDILDYGFRGGKIRGEESW